VPAAEGGAARLFADTRLCPLCAVPIDITKTRLQLQGQHDFVGTKYGFVGMITNIAKTEGVGGLYAGVTPAIARHIPYTGFRAIGYEYIRGFFCGSVPKEQAPLYAKMAAGMTAGGIGQAIAVPCDLIKVRMQGDGRLVAAGKLEKPRYAGMFDAFTKIKAESGIAGFYAGCSPAILRAALVNLGELTTYDSAKKVRPLFYTKGRGREHFQGLIGWAHATLFYTKTGGGGTPTRAMGWAHATN